MIGGSSPPSVLAALSSTNDIVPGVFAHSTPLQTFTTPPNHRSYIDEGNDDLVVIGPGTVTFSRVALLDDSGWRKTAREFVRSSSRSPATDSNAGTDLSASFGTFLADAPDYSAGSPRVGSTVGSPQRGGDSEVDGFGRSPDTERSASLNKTFNDVLVLQTKQPDILMAKRPCTRTSTKQHGGVAAVLHDAFTLSIYNMYRVVLPPTSAGTAPPNQARAFMAGTAPVAGNQAAARLGGAAHSVRMVDAPMTSAALVMREGPLEPIALYECRPKNVRFGNGAYSIRDFFWLPAPLAWASGGTKLRSPNATQAIIIVSEIALDVVQVFPFARKTEHVLVALQRITTRSDYCVYDRFSRVLVSVNSRKPHILKSFAVLTRVTAPSGTRSRDNQLAALSPESAGIEDNEVTVLTSAGLDGAADAPSQVLAAHPVAASDAQYSIVPLPQVKLEDSDARVLSDAWMPLNHMRPHPYAPAVRPVTLYNRLFITVITTRQEIVLWELIFDRPPDLSATHFERTAVLCLQESNAKHIVIPYDNLLLANCLDNGLTFVYDVHVDETTDPLHATPVTSLNFARNNGSLTAYSSPGFLPGFAARLQSPASTVPRASSPSSVEPSSFGFGFTSSSYLKSFAAPTAQASVTPPAAVDGAHAVHHVPITVVRLHLYATKLGSAIASSGGSASADAPGGSASADARIFTAGGLYSGSTPLVLDRAGGRVFLLGMNHAAVVVSLQQMHTKTMRYLSCRSGAGATMAAVELLKRAVFDQEPLAFVGRMFDILTERDFTSQSVTWHSANLLSAAVAPSFRGAHVGNASSRSEQSVSRPMVRVNPVAADGLFHARRAMPVGTAAVLGDASSAARIIAGISEAGTSAPAHLTLLAALDAEQGLEVAEFYARIQKASNSSPQQKKERALDEPKLRIPQLLILRLIFEPMVELLRAKRDQESLTDESVPRSSYFLRYARAVILEYTRAVATPRVGAQRVDLHPEIQALLLDLSTMAPCPDYFSLHQMLMYRVVEDSVPVALRLLSLTEGYAPAFQAALDMLGRLKAYDTIIDIYLRFGMPIRAIKVALATGNASVSAATFLDAVLKLDKQKEESKLCAAEVYPAENLDYAQIEALEHQRLLHPPHMRSLFAEAFMMLRPRLRLVAADATQQPLAATPTSARYSGEDPRSPRRALSPTAGVNGTSSSLPPPFTLPISQEDYGRFSAVFSTLSSQSMALSR